MIDEVTNALNDAPDNDFVCLCKHYEGYFVGKKGV
jgi:hypothetical protein